ncbi:MAG: LysM peptidoglycan-binding domain-containing protein [Lactobacillus panisapium]|uniref:LysM peptidoglycan-binding domain-containing protein n=1 Tax=Lactobacillus TaxID=1578 RepID=UPI00226BA3BC|nr:MULTISPECIES: LysM peptidoglycan-binding domain-containing protein [Lactobacillus]MCO6532609.1 LysM peptidoglycan-binding domain-containing protein [Lactobacillus sp.]MCO6534963.1 LysM peptidoglycan-binding domain-containing protein [Lactobacillus sp.]MCT6820701.1 LysM peptidoglycan-binding domain-containing protein [Lactobacillus panisapium]MCT6853214.1 LysM peptidoglycan-binding domain-containing protein [Lactobacillus panisapium]MCT6865638.1 LysM peptidoglycan-binding domain-containing p
MNQNPQGPFKHYERPHNSRTMINKSGSKYWMILMVLIVIIIVALVPVVHHLAANSETSNRVVELQKATKKRKRVTEKKTSKTQINAKVKDKAKKKTLSKPKVQAQDKPAETKVKQYTVQSGDSLTSIADKFNLTVNDLAQLNQLNPEDQVNAGQKLRVK